MMGTGRGAFYFHLSVGSGFRLLSREAAGGFLFVFKLTFSQTMSDEHAEKSCRIQSVLEVDAK